MADESDTCGYADTTTGHPCQQPAGENGRCHIPSHNPGEDDDNPMGRPRAFDEEWRRKALYNAVRTGAVHVHHQASIAGVDPTTLRRSLCCVDSPREPELTVPPGDACEFCTEYTRAHSEGAVETLENCKPEFVASAAYGYTKTERQEMTGEGGGPIQTAEVTDEELAMLEAAFDDEPET